MKDKKVRTNHHFTENQIKWMEDYRQETGTSAAELLRCLLNEYITKYDRTRNKIKNRNIIQQSSL